MFFHYIRLPKYNTSFSSVLFSHFVMSNSLHPMHQACLIITNNAIQPSHPLLSRLLLISIFSSISVFSNELVLCIRWPKYWSFGFSISSSNEYSWMISFSIDWFDLLTVQGTHKRLLLYHSSKASILQHSASFVVKLSYPYMTTGKTRALSRWTTVSKAMSLLFNMLSGMVTAFFFFFFFF